VLSLALISAATACGWSQDPSHEIIEHRLRPALANSAVTQFNEEHLFLVARAAAAKPAGLLLLLSGTGGAPEDARLVAKVGAEQGYHVVALMYPNSIAVLQACATAAAGDCMARVREEIITGADLSARISVDAVNSIDGRLADALRALAQQHPDEGWGAFLVDGTPAWNRIAVGGLSQGGGHAAYIAKMRSVPRVLMFGAPADGFDSQAAPWMTLGATPVSRYFGFRHERDPFTSIEPNWRALGMASFGDSQRVEDTPQPYAGSHMLVTDLLPATGSFAMAHASVFVDAATPRSADGSPRFVEAWKYLIGRP
jgi:hypothetical protein